ncbi:MAG: pyruvate dehydrogenase (acetyl-transferring) E1 component subunit alpha, partial [Gemmatimonadota bacterium]
MAETKTRKKSSSAKKGGALDTHGIGEELAVDILRDMLLYRRFEEKAEEGYAIGKIGGFCHLHIGQEAGAAGCIKP